MFWLIGLMGTGKTIAGRGAAARLGLPFVDTDLAVTELTGLTVSQIWSKGGEPLFREWERKVVSSIDSSPKVVAAGGGAPMDIANQTVIASGDSVVWLDADLSTVVTRLDDVSERPLASEGDLETTLGRLFSARESTYAALATARIDTSDMSRDQVVNELVQIWSA